MSDLDRLIARAMSLPIWKAPRDPELLSGGITNVNVKLKDGDKAYVVRVGGDIDTHHVKRFNELACHRASEAAGISPRVVYVEDGILAMEFIEGRVLDASSLAEPGMVDRVAELLRRLHRNATAQLRGPVLVFWVFHVLRDYAARLEAAGSPYSGEIASLLEKAAELEAAVGPIELALTHNDLLPANLLDTGERLWLIDWDYGGFNTPLFDLASIASNCSLSQPLTERLLAAYYDEPVPPALWRRFKAMICASLLRETMWSMVSEITSVIDFDYAAYTLQYRARFDAAYSEFQNL